MQEAKRFKKDDEPKGPTRIIDFLQSNIEKEQPKSSHYGCCCISCVIEEQDKKMNPANCKCNVCVNRLFATCETKKQLLIGNLENEIKEKQQQLYQLKKQDTILNNIIFEYK
jgi:hypothetical protein